MKRTATCDCGELSISLDGDPYVLVCNCDSCQRRTGSAFGMSAYYDAEDVVSITGPCTEYTRKSQFAKMITFSFCPTCGTSVFWRLEAQPDKIGIAVGCFNDPSFPAPESVHHLDGKLDWVTFPESMRRG